MTERLFAIFGAGGFGRELIHPAQMMLAAQAAAGAEPRKLVFVTDEPGPPVLGIERVSPARLGKDDDVVIAIGDGQVRRSIAERLTARTAMLFDPSARIGPDVAIGEGAVFCPFTHVTASARIGRHFQCNIYSYVAHDCVIGDFVTFAPKVSCNGNVHILDGAYIGTGAVLKQGTPDRPLVIGEGAVVGMGAVVTKDVAPGAVVVGNPARPRV